MDWYRKSVDETARALGTDAAMGLTAEEAGARLEKHGPNALKQGKKRTLWQMYLAQFKDVMVLVLLAAALISGVLLGEWVDAGIILLVVLLNALLGVIQENRAEKSLEALKKLSSPHAKVRREGALLSVPASDLVPGDVVLLEAGDYVSADLRLTVSAGLRVDESALTGESEPVEKHAETLPQEGDLPLGDRTNLAFSGSWALSPACWAARRAWRRPCSVAWPTWAKSWRCCALGYACWSLWQGWPTETMRARCF